MAGGAGTGVGGAVGVGVDAGVLNDAWIAGLVEASAGLADVAGHSGVVAVTIGKNQRAVLDIVDGRVVGRGSVDDVAVTVPVTTAQLDDYTTGVASMATDYMRGDVKPVGSTGAFLALLELFENPAFRAALATEA